MAILMSGGWKAVVLLPLLCGKYSLNYDWKGHPALHPATLSSVLEHQTIMLEA